MSTQTMPLIRTTLTCMIQIYQLTCKCFKTISDFCNGSKTGRFDEISPNKMSRMVLEKDKFCEMVEFTKSQQRSRFLQNFVHLKTATPSLPAFTPYEQVMLTLVEFCRLTISDKFTV